MSLPKNTYSKYCIFYVVDLLKNPHELLEIFATVCEMLCVLVIPTLYSDYHSLRGDEGSYQLSVGTPFVVVCTAMIFRLPS